MIRRTIAAFLTASLLGAGPAPASIRGFTPAQQAAEQRYESIVNSSPNAAQATRDEMGMASYVHRMGLAGDKRSAQYFRDELAKAGWDARLVEYDVAIAYPTLETLALTAPTKRDVDLYEPAVAGDRYSENHAAIGKPYSAYSVDGDVTGPVVYANYGKPEDYAALAAMRVSVRGAIVLARVGGGGSLTGKAYEAAKHGARAVLLFSDPMNGGYWDGQAYPDGPYRPLGGAMRNTLTLLDDPGDPTAIGVPVPGAKHKAFSAIQVPPIPETPVTGLVARQLLEAMNGPIVPRDWHPGFAMPVHTGGSLRAHFKIISKRFIGPIWDVIATMPGIDPRQMVVVGGHRDAWTYGAVDPVSGSVDMLQLGRALGKLKAQGWKPQRTIVIGSWDGEETNLFGSDAWVVQHEAQLRAGCVAYVNTDEVAFGPQFGAYATPDLAGLLRDVARAAIAPDGTVLANYWHAQDAKQEVGFVGGGSDHEPFVYHEGLPAAGAGYGGPFGTYHSAYDDPASLRIFDPGMREAVAAARYTGLVVLRLAGATYPDVRLGDLASAMQKRITDAKNATLLPLAQDFTAAANELDAQADAAVQDGDAAKAREVQTRLRNAEAAFFQADASTWNRSLLYGMSASGAAILPNLDKTQNAVAAALRAATAIAQE
ncbi:MAG TPA: M28 family peptidase [Candidatus Baltobacteraceae bacterium]|nr:M28 family peptidase [Candidatus Baltobacteraceae bacterium]